MAYHLCNKNFQWVENEKIKLSNKYKKNIPYMNTNILVLNRVYIKLKVHRKVYPK